ncbi:MAG: DUF1287 domain-containing protein [Blastochloris sp.]|nr:DUF1287 domain-containing protein [Blastochloris sp.]
MTLRLDYLLLFLLATTLPLSAQDFGLRLAQAAESQIGQTLLYDPSYQALAYPGGDVPPDRGVCSDVIIRALRQQGIDLQVALHQDMTLHFKKYPPLWNLARPDRNIDHRRVPNLEYYFQRQGFSLPLSRNPGNFLPGDIVSVRLANQLPHIMIVSTQKNANGQPLIVHNIGAGTRMEDSLFAFRMIGHYRIQAKLPRSP